MTDDALSLRLATADDVPFLARVITEVAEGIVETLMGGLFPGVRAEKLLQMILGKGAGAYRIEHAVIADYRGEAAGLLFSYDASEQKVSPLMRGLVPKKRLSQCEELLAATADDAWWVDTFWVAPQYRGEGLAQILMACAEDLARDAVVEDARLDLTQHVAQVDQQRLFIDYGAHLVLERVEHQPDERDALVKAGGPSALDDLGLDVGREPILIGFVGH